MTKIKKLLSKIVNAKPTMFSSSVALNICGYHFVRIFAFYLHRKVRIPQTIDPRFASYIKTIDDEGMVAIPNFFSPTDYEKIKNAYDRLTPQFEDDPSEIPIPRVNRLFLWDKRFPKDVAELFVKNEAIGAVARGYLNRVPRLPMQADFTRISCKESEINLPSNGGTNNIHFDAPLRVLKAFYFITDTDENNAAFRFVKGSHKRNTLKRLLLEYKMSIRYALNKYNPNHGGEYLDNEPWVKLSQREVDEHNLEPVPMPVKGNTIVLADVGAFHRRGSFLKEGVRDALEINFRSVETLHNDFYPLITWLKRLTGTKQSNSIIREATY
jgi:hypothetical protein